ncbi:MAG: ABC transporter substrate-binding protein [Trebonia sp.]
MSNDRMSRLRTGQGEIANHVIDEFAAGRLSRRELLRGGTIAGLSMPLLGAVLAACGSSPSAATGGGSSSPAGKAGALIRAGSYTPSGAMNPVTVDDIGGIAMLGQTGEYLCVSQQDLTLKPGLATKWSANATADVWTFDIRQGVKFHDGTPLTADDVVYTFKLHTNPKGSANALSAFGGVLLPEGVVKTGAYTVEFHLTAPTGSFPYLTSSDNYNLIILPNKYDPAKWESSFLGTGPFKLASYQPQVGASFTRNASYWGAKALPSGSQFTFYADQTPMILALTSGSIDTLQQFAVAGGEQLLSGGYNIIKLKSSAHRELSMRCDKPPFNDARVRQALALSLDRPGIAKALFQQYSDLGNDSPFAPVYPSTNTSVPQRAQNLARAKSLLTAAGHPNGFATELFTLQLQEVPKFAQIVAQSAAAIGIKIKLNVESTSAYYGKATFGNSDWLDGAMSLVNYGHRSVPDVFLNAPLETYSAKKGTGSWNAAHFVNPQYDKLVGQYTAAIDLTAKRSLAGKIEQLLLDQTPIVFAYFYNYLEASGSGVHGVYPTAISHLFLNNATKD